MKKLLLFLGFAFSISTTWADHITGGEMYYYSTGVSNGQYTYNGTLKLFMRCNSGRQFNDPTIISIFNKSTNSRVSDTNVRLARRETLQLTNHDKCINNPPIVCYEVGYYEFTISVPPSADGYIISGQVNYRVAGINNLVRNYVQIGATYTAELPGTSTTNNDPHNISGRFIGSDLVEICSGNNFSYSFAAEDRDGDQLRYSFCNAYKSSSEGGPNSSSPPGTPPYEPVPYSTNYSGASPLGTNVHINSNTGLVTGIAPQEAGIYVVTVCITEIRNGKIIATQRKDIQINIAPCTIVGADLPDDYMLCRDTKTITLFNRSVSALIVSQQWELFNDKGTSLFSSADPTITYSFPDTGVYSIKLVVNRGKECSDSTTSHVKVYPGLLPNFDVAGICYKKPTHFTDKSTSVYGLVNYREWEFGEDDIALSFSNQTNPDYTYAATGPKNVRLIASNSVGCIDTIFKTVVIIEKPVINLAFRDTLICIHDEIRLAASGEGSFSWLPAMNIRDLNTGNPLVSPAATTTYFVQLNEDGCLNQDSVHVRVTDHVNLKAMNDTTICAGDSLQFRIVSDAFKYSWSPSAQFVDPGVKNAVTITAVSTTYQVAASIGSCVAKTSISVTAVPYPAAFAGADTSICYNSSVHLHAVTDGAFFQWSPGASLDNAAGTDPLASPLKTTTYIFSAYGNKGCPKPGHDTITVRVLPQIHAYAGRDTAVVVNQPLQLAGSGGTTYVWSPSTGLSSSLIADPVAIFSQPSDGLQYKVLAYNEAHCVDSSSVKIKVFKSLPKIFVPNAFSPDGNGRNEFFRPIAAGISNIEYFKVFNRWGQLVFSSGISNRGWDGAINGRPQDPGIYIWMVKATDYLGKPYFEKGSVVLIR